MHETTLLFVEADCGLCECREGHDRGGCSRVREFPGVAEMDDTAGLLCGSVRKSEDPLDAG